VRRIILFLAVAALSACAYPTGSVQQGEAPSAVYVVAAAEGTEIYIDGVRRGLASDYDGKKKVLRVTPGRHVVELRTGAEVLLKKTVFVAEGAQIAISAE
jgi:hypothetical protein